MGWAGRRGGGKPRRALSAALVLVVGFGVGLTVVASPAVALTAMVPAADPPATPVIDSAPTDPTTATALTWGFDGASPAVCEISQGIDTVATQDPCVSPVSFDPLPAGSYSFTVYAADAASAIGPDTPSQSAAFTVSDPSDPTASPAPTDPSTAAPTPAPTDSASPAPTDSSSPAPTDSPTDSSSPSPADSSSATSPAQSQTSGVPPLAGVPGPPVVAAAADRGFSIAPTFAVSGVDDGATLSCSLLGPDGSADQRITTCDTVSQLDLTGAGAGSYLFSVSQTVGGLTGPIGAASYLFETTPSVVSAATSGVGAAPTYPVSGYDAVDTTLHCSVAGPTPTTTTSPAAVTSCGPTAANVAIGVGGAGTYTVSVYAKDGAGNVSATSTASYEYEPAAPPAPTVTAPVNFTGGDTGADRHPVFAVADSESVDLTYTCTVIPPTTLPPTVVPSADCGSPSTLDLDGLADGSYTLRVTATDALGQVSPMGSATYVLDTTTPTPTLSLTDPTSSPSADPTPTFTISDPESVDGPDSFLCSWGLTSDVPAATGQPCGTGASVTRTFPATEGDGTYQLVVTATDSLGNSATDTSGDAATTSTTYQLEVVTPAPSVVLSDPNVASTTPAADLTPSFTITENDLVGGPDSYYCSWGLASDTPAAPATLCGSGPVVSVAFTASEGDGYYALTVTAVNSLGGSVRVLPPNALNDPASTTTANYTLDATTPVPKVKLAAGQTTPSTRVNPTYTISDTESVDAPESYTCVWSVAGATAPLSSGSCGSGMSTSQQFSANAGDGAYTLAVTATDALGNTATRSVTYTLDTTTSAPRVALTSEESTPSTLTTPKFTISDSETADTYSCAWGLKGASPSPVATTCTSGQAFSASSGDGVYELVVTATDPLGNAVTDAHGDPASTSFDYTLDTSTAAPSVSLIDPVSTPSTRTNPTYSITDSDPYDGPDSFTCVWQKVGASRPISSGPCGSGPTSTAQFAASQGDGPYSLTVTAKDVLGNTGTGSVPAVTTVSYVLDTTTAAPSITLVSGESTPSTNATPQFVVTDAESLDPPESYTCTWRLQGAAPISSGSCDPSGGPLSFSASAGDGPYQLTVVATDALGNTVTDAAGDPASTTVDYRLDTRTPAPTVVLSAGLSTPSSNNRPTFVISDTERYALPETYSCVWEKTGDTTPISSAACGSATTTQLFTASEGDGDYQLTVLATDRLGNATTGAGSTASSTTVTYRLDSTTPAPVVSLAAPLHNPGSSKAPTFVISDAETLDGPDTFKCQWYFVPSASQPLQLLATGPCASGVSYAAGNGDGTYDLVVTATDTAGNPATAPYLQYVLDTTPPEVPTVTLASASPSSDLSPTWTWREAFDDPTPITDLTATCTITGPDQSGQWSSGPQPCPATYSAVLGGQDGLYTLSVVLTDEAGNSSPAATATYDLDSHALDGAVVKLLRPGPQGFSRHPVWSVTGPAGTTLMCTLHRGGPTSLVTIGKEAVCQAPSTFSLVGQPAGEYTLWAVTVDAINGTSSPAKSSYVLRPGTPRVDPPKTQNPRATWTVHGVAGDEFECSLQSGGDQPTPSSYAPCGTKQTYNMSLRPAGDYTLSVRQVITVDGETVSSAPGTASWFWTGTPKRAGTTPPTTPPASGIVITIPPTHGGSGPTHAAPVTTSKILSIQQQLKTTGHIAKAIVAPLFHAATNRYHFGATVGTIQDAVSGVGSAGGGTGFPLILVSLVLVFLLVQNRIDRRDPKLALASIAADDHIEFQPPPSRKNLS